MGIIIPGTLYVMIGSVSSFRRHAISCLLLSFFDIISYDNSSMRDGIVKVVCSSSIVSNPVGPRA